MQVLLSVTHSRHGFQPVSTCHLLDVFTELVYKEALGFRITPALYFHQLLCLPLQKHINDYSTHSVMFLYINAVLYFY